MNTYATFDNPGLIKHGRAIYHNAHPVEILKDPSGESVAIDALLATFIQKIWDDGFVTYACCQGTPGGKDGFIAWWLDTGSIEAILGHYRSVGWPPYWLTFDFKDNIHGDEGRIAGYVNFPGLAR